MKFFQEKPVIAVHDGRFHADDIFACATLQVLLGGRGRIVRTRDQKTIEAADYVVDVGCIYDPTKKRFDHHMPEGAGKRENGIPYAAFGLVWKEYGAAISGTPEIAARIDQKLVSSIDADDNGVSLVDLKTSVIPYGMQNFLYTYRPTWKEDPKMYDMSFLKLVQEAKRIISREIIIARDSLEAETKVEAQYQKASDKRIVELDGPYPYQETLARHAEPLFVVMPRFGSGDWKVETVHAKPFGFENRKSLPASWAGLRDEAFAKASGVPDAVFCHNARFLAVAKTRAGALALAKLAVEA